MASNAAKPSVRFFDLGSLDEGVFERLGRLVGLVRNTRATHRTVLRAVTAHVGRVRGECHSLDLAPFDITKSHSELLHEGWRQLNKSWWRAAKWMLPLLAASVALSFGYAVHGDPRGASSLGLEALDVWLDHIAENLRSVYVPAVVTITLIAAATYGTQLARVINSSRLRTAREALAADRRPPVLLIRSFADDSAQIYNVDYQVDSEGNVQTYIVASRLETALAPQLSELGPLIAVGNPNEVFPARGAARIHFANEGWQRPVVALIEQARMIVLVAALDPAKTGENVSLLTSEQVMDALALTPGVRWEIEYIRTHAHLGKLLVVLKPPAANGWNDAMEWLLAWSAAAKAARAKRLRERSVLALLFKRDGGVDLIRTREKLHSTELYERAIRFAYHQIFCSD